MVLEGRVELPRPCGHTALNRACLPIPPLEPQLVTTEIKIDIGKSAGRVSLVPPRAHGISSFENPFGFDIPVLDVQKSLRLVNNIGKVNAPHPGGNAVDVKRVDHKDRRNVVYHQFLKALIARDSKAGIGVGAGVKQKLVGFLV